MVKVEVTKVWQLTCIRINKQKNKEDLDSSYSSTIYYVSLMDFSMCNGGIILELFWA